MDEIIHVSAFPAANDKVEVLTSERALGGLAAIALVTAARQGATCRLVTVLGDDDLSQYVRIALAAEGIDTDLVISIPDAGPVHSFVVVASDQSRTLFFDVSAVASPSATLPDATVLEADLVFLDHFAGPAGVQAAKVARERGIPVVADLEGTQFAQFEEIFDAADHLVISAPFAASLTGRASAADAAEALWREDRTAVVVTSGERGSWVRTSEPAVVQHVPAFPVVALDTTGCGDVFHGAYAAELACRRPVREAVRYASAAAALKARGSGINAIPRRDDVTSFMLASA